MAKNNIHFPWITLIYVAIAILIGSAAVFYGEMLLGGLYVGLIAILWVGNYLIHEDSDDNDGEAVHVLVYPLLFIILLPGAAGFIVAAQSETTYSVETVEYDIYHITAPFGILERDVSGSFATALSFGTGSVNSNAEEIYNVKYFVGNELRTETFIATDTPLTIDGAFVLTQNLTYSQRHNWLWGDDKITLSKTSGMQIHLPGLPSVNGTTTEYKVIG